MSVNRRHNYVENEKDRERGTVREREMERASESIVFFSRYRRLDDYILNTLPVSTALRQNTTNNHPHTT